MMPERHLHPADERGQPHDTDHDRHPGADLAQFVPHGPGRRRARHQADPAPRRRIRRTGLRGGLAAGDQPVGQLLELLFLAVGEQPRLPGPRDDARREVQVRVLDRGPQRVDVGFRRASCRSGSPRRGARPTSSGRSPRSAAGCPAARRPRPPPRRPARPRPRRSLGRGLGHEDRLRLGCHDGLDLGDRLGLDDRLASTTGSGTTTGSTSATGSGSANGSSAGAAVTGFFAVGSRPAIR